MSAYTHFGKAVARRIAPSPRILIVDDDSRAASSLMRMLGRAGHTEIRVETAGDSALAAAVEFQPAIVFVDVELLALSGYEIARLLHQHPLLQHIRLIALTDSGEHPAREDARVAGFERYLVKPVTPAALQEVLDALA